MRWIESAGGRIKDDNNLIWINSSGYYKDETADDRIVLVDEKLQLQIDFDVSIWIAAVFLRTCRIETDLIV